MIMMMTGRGVGTVKAISDEARMQRERRWTASCEGESAAACRSVAIAINKLDKGGRRCLLYTAPRRTYTHAGITLICDNQGFGSLRARRFAPWSLCETEAREAILGSSDVLTLSLSASSRVRLDKPLMPSHMLDSEIHCMRNRAWIFVADVIARSEYFPGVRAPSR